MCALPVWSSPEGGGCRPLLGWQAVDWGFLAGAMAACFLSLEMKTRAKGPLISTLKGNAL